MNTGNFKPFHLIFVAFSILLLAFSLKKRSCKNGSFANYYRPGPHPHRRPTGREGIGRYAHRRLQQFAQEKNVEKYTIHWRCDNLDIKLREGFSVEVK